MANYLIVSTSRVTMPDPVALTATIRTTVDPAAGVSVPFSVGGSYTVKKATPFSAADVTACQTAVDAAPALTPQRIAQNDIDNWPIVTKALALALLDQINVLRAALPTPLSAITPAQALAAIRTKAGTL